MKPDERYALELVGLPGWSAPAIVRVRKALKVLLRGYGLKCVDLKELSPAQPKTAAGRLLSNAQPLRERHGGNHDQADSEGPP
jgi:hypothetical protein